MARGVTLSVEAKALKGTPSNVTRFVAWESIDEPYSLVLEIAIEDRDADPLSMLGKDLALVIDRAGQQRRIVGIVRSVTEGHHGETAVHARVEVVPALWLLSLRRTTRMFQEKTVPEILEAVLGEALGTYGRSAQLELSASYPKREYCMQYQESDLDFVHRLMEEEGIFYAFDHEGATEVMVLRDTNDACARAASAADPIPLQPHNLQTTDAEPVHELALEHRHAPTSVVIRDFDWTKGGFVVEDEERGQDALGRDRESYEHGRAKTLSLTEYDAGARRYQKQDAAAQKKVRLEAHSSDAIVGAGVSRVIGFVPGATFALAGHPTAGVDGEYLITRVEHRDRPAGDESDPDQYHNRFECIPLDVPYRPRRRTRKPTIPGIQTAVVTGPSGEEIHTDEHGRIKVQFHWDRDNPADETSSVWVRSEQAWAGPGWGFWWLPRIGMEVVVHFRNGDPDRPIVTGCVYNADNPLPYPLPDEKTKSTIKSNSSPGGGGSNELRFEDKAGSEEIYVHAQKDYNEVVENNHTTLVHHDQTNTVDNDQTQKIGVDQFETVHGNQEMSVGGDRTVHVKGNFEETVDGTETRHTAGDVTESFDANETRSIGAAVTEDIGADETRTVGADQSESIGASHTLDVGGSVTRTISGALTLDVSAGVSEETPASYALTATGGLTVTLGASANFTAPGGIKLISPGGITWTDSFDEWWGQIKKKATPYADGTFAVKYEFGGLAIGYATVKIEQAGIEFINDSSGQIANGIKMITSGGKAEGGGVNKKSSGVSSQAG